MKIGDVIYDPNYAFPAGGCADKIFIVISDPAKDKIVMVMVTSHGKDSKNKGCQPTPKKFLIKSGENGFHKDTWVDLARNIAATDTKAVQEKIDTKAVVVLSTLPLQRVNEIKNCLKKHALESLSREACEVLGFKPGW